MKRLSLRNVGSANFPERSGLHESYTMDTKTPDWGESGKTSWKKVIFKLRPRE